MIIPRCSRCGKPAIRELCLTCRNIEYKELYSDGNKQRFRVKCVICGRRSYTTKEKYLTEDYKCLTCR